MDSKKSNFNFQNLNFHVSPKSANAKTGPIVVTTSDRRTCPTTCHHRGNTCYAEQHPLIYHWNKVTRGERGASAPTFLESLQKALLANPSPAWRDCQAGDQPVTTKGVLRKSFLLAKEAISRKCNRKGFTYTHHICDPQTKKGQINLEIIKEVNRRGGFTVNVSADSLEDADILAREGIPVVVSLPLEACVTKGGQKTLKTPEGRTVTICPATYKDINCVSCKFLCSRESRSSIVGFPAHGVKAKSFKPLRVL